MGDCKHGGWLRTQRHCDICELERERWSAPYAAVPAGLTAEGLASVGPCSDPVHPYYLGAFGNCPSCGDTGYPTADERELIDAGDAAESDGGFETFMGELQRKQRVDNCGVFPDPTVACMPANPETPTLVPITLKMAERAVNRFAERYPRLYRECKAEHPERSLVPEFRDILEAALKR